MSIWGGLVPQGGIFDEAIAPSLTESGRGVARAGDSRGQDPLIACFGGNNTSGPIETATACNAHGGPHGRLDFESETFVTQCYGICDDETVAEDVMPTIPTPSVSGGGHPPAIAMPILEAGARTGKSTDDPRAGIGIGSDGDPMFTLQSGKQHAVAFHENQRGELTVNDTAGSLKVGGGKPGQGYPAICAFKESQSGTRTGDVHATLDANKGSRRVEGVMSGMAVRRLTPRECERLQGLPDDYTLIPYNGKMAADGPRYKAIGNGMAVPVVRWIGERIQAVMQP